MYFPHGPESPESLGYNKKPLVIGSDQSFLQLHFAPTGRALQFQAVHPYFQGPDGLQQRTLKATVDGHNLTSSLHLCSQGAVGAAELVKGPAGNFNHHVVQGRLEASRGFSCNRVNYLVQIKPHCNLCGHFCDGIAGGL